MMQTSWRKPTTRTLCLLLVVFILFFENLGVSSSLSALLEQVRSVDDSAASTSTLIFQSSEEESSSFSDDLTDASEWNISVVVQLSGELGNHLSKIAFGYSVQQRLWERYRLASHLVLQHQERGSKWISARRDVQTCFPHFRSTDFCVGNSPEFQHRLQQQREWLGGTNASKLVLANLISSEDVDASLFYLNELLRQQNRSDVLTSPLSDHLNPGNISLPFLYAQSFASLEDIDAYYHELQNLFVFDEESCCRAVPAVDEHVFHFRNYLAEMPRRAKKKGFEELSPNQTVIKLLGSGDSTETTTKEKKIVMTTRRYNEDAQAYLDAFSQSGWSARIVENQTGTQDFCFLKRAQGALVGMSRSTYVLWAGLLGNASSVKLYSINSTETRAALGDESVSIGYRWKTPDLRDRIQFVTITPRNETEAGGNSTPTIHG